MKLKNDQSPDFNRICLKRDFNQLLQFLQNEIIPFVYSLPVDEIEKKRLLSSIKYGGVLSSLIVEDKMSLLVLGIKNPNPLLRKVREDVGFREFILEKIEL